MKAHRVLAILAVNAAVVWSGTTLDARAQPASAASPGQMDMSAGTAGMPAPAGGPQPASTRAFERNAANMMKNMSAPGYTGNADADFVAHMIPHHQGAVDQAEVELRYGKDPQIRALARNIIKAQQEEIAFMERWQAKHPVTAR